MSDTGAIRLSGRMSHESEMSLAVAFATCERMVAVSADSDVSSTARKPARCTIVESDETLMSDANARRLLAALSADSETSDRIRKLAPAALLLSDDSEISLARYGRWATPAASSEDSELSDTARVECAPP